MKKYELTDISKMNHYGGTLYRIRALREFLLPERCQMVRTGELGGWVESEKNLSQEGCCWVSDEARVFDDALVAENAVVSDEAIVFDDAVITGNAHISERATVRDNGYILGEACISGNACIHGRNIVRGNAIVSGNTCIGNNGFISSNADFCTLDSFAEHPLTIYRTVNGYKIDYLFQSVSLQEVESKVRHKLEFKIIQDIVSLRNLEWSGEYTVYEQQVLDGIAEARKVVNNNYEPLTTDEEINIILDFRAGV